MHRCLMVSSDPERDEAVHNGLERYGLSVRLAADGGAMRRALAQDRFDMLLLNTRLPREDGLELCRRVLKEYDLPVIAFTPDGDLISRVLALEIGADDCMSRPIIARELVARIQAVLRRWRRPAAPGHPAAAESPAQWHFEGWCFDRQRDQLGTPEGATVALSALESRLLSAFLEHAGQVLTREQLGTLARTRGRHVNGRYVDLAVSRLRTKLGDTPRAPRLLHTVRGMGYRFEGAVRQGLAKAS